MVAGGRADHVVPKRIKPARVHFQPAPFNRRAVQPVGGKQGEIAVLCEAWGKQAELI